MPRLVNLGPPYGTVAWPDDATDEQIVADYDSLETERLKQTKEAKLIATRLADLAEAEQPTLGKTLLRTGLGIREGAVGTTKQAVGGLTRAIADRFRTSEDPEAWANIASEAGRALSEEGTRQLGEAQYEGERLGGGLPGQLGQTIGGIAGASAPALLAAPLGLPAAAVAGGLQTFGPTVEQFRSRLQQLNPGLSEEQATRQAEGPAALASVATAVLTRVFGGTERLIARGVREGIGRPFVANVLREGFKAAALEFPEETLQQLASGVIEKAAIDPSRNLGDIVNESLLAGLAGFGLGAVTGGGVAGTFATGQAVGERYQEGVLRRQSQRESTARVRQAIAEREIQDAQRIGAETRPAVTPGQQAPVVEGTEEPLQVRSAQIGGVEAVPGEVTPPPLPPPPPVTQPPPAPASAPAPVAAPVSVPNPRGLRIGDRVSTDRGITGVVQAGTQPVFGVEGIPDLVVVADADQRTNAGTNFPLNEMWRPLAEVQQQIVAKPFERAPYESVVPNLPYISKEVADKAFAVLERLHNRLTARGIDPDTSDANRTQEARYMQEITGSLERYGRGRKAVQKKYKRADQKRVAADNVNLNKLLGEALEFATEETTLPTPEPITPVPPPEAGPQPLLSAVLSASQAGGQVSLDRRQAELRRQSSALYPAGGQQFNPVNFDELMGPDGFVDWAKVRLAIRSGTLTGGESSNALALHLLTASNLHPANIQLLDRTPQETAILSDDLTTQWYGRITPKADRTQPYLIEIVRRGLNGKPISQGEFLRTLNHELTHNNVTLKWKGASAQIQQDLRDLLSYVRHRSKGTEFENHNVVKDVDEFLAEAFANQSVQKWLASLDYGEVLRIMGTKPQVASPTVRRSAFNRLLDIIKRILNLPDFIVDHRGGRVDAITALDQAVALGALLEGRARPIREAAVPVISPPGFDIGESLYSPVQQPPPIAQAQVSGAAAEVGRIIEEAYAKREDSPKVLEKLAYETQQFKAARNELKRLSDLAAGRLIADGYTPETVEGGFPDPTVGVSIVEGQIVVEDEFVDQLAGVGIPVNASNVQAMQAEVFFEQAAHRLLNLRGQLETLQQALAYYQAMGVAQAEANLPTNKQSITKVNRRIAKLTNQIAKLAPAEHEGLSVEARANEIDADLEQRQARLGQRDSLSLEPVSEFFGKNIGAYRNFKEKVDAAAKLAASLRDAATDPAERQRLAAEYQKWAVLPDDVARSLSLGHPLSTEQLASAFASLALAFEEFDIQRKKMQELRDIRGKVIDAALAELFDKATQAKIDRGMADVLLADVTAALDGEAGGTGTLQGLGYTQKLREQISAIKVFAEQIGKNIETREELFDWLANPTEQPRFVTAAAESYGVSEETLRMILDEVRRNPDFASSIMTLILASDKRMAEIPAPSLEAIVAAYKAGDFVLASRLARPLFRAARSRSSAAGAMQRETAKRIDELEIEQIALDEGNAMFDETAGNPAFIELRNTVGTSRYGLVEPMVLQNNTATTFKGFTIPGKADQSYDELSMGAADSPVLKGEWFVKVAEWHRAATAYVEGYTLAADAFAADPTANPDPLTLGYDLARVRGLRDAIERFVRPSFLELSLLSENKRWRVPWLVRKLNKLAWFRQHDFVAKMVGGVPGTDLRARLADFINHFLIARSVIQKYQDIPDFINKAMKSHPSVQMNMAGYREIFNELAHYGRQFGTPLRVGFVMPRSGTIVTAEDLALLRRQIAFEEDLRRRVTETTPVAGVRIKSKGRDLVRSGAYVGDLGMPRHLNRQDNSFIADVMAAYGDSPGFDITTTLGPSSTDPVVAYWNKNIHLLKQHVLDATRTDRAMRLSPQMAQAERDAMNDWMANGVPAFHSVEELVNILAQHHQPMQGVNVRDRVIVGLNAELKQYRDAANRIAQERAESDQARHSKVSIPFSAENEFTRPAAQLELPSAYYDYGALTPGEHLTITSRANHERVVAYATAVQRAINELQNRLDRVRNLNIPANERLTPEQAAQSYGGNINELKDVLGLLQKIGEDFRLAYALGSPTLTQSEWYREGFGTLTSAVLALPTVGLRNITSGQFEVYLGSRAMGLAGERLLLWDAFKNMPRTLARGGLAVADALARKTDSFAAMLTGTNKKVFEQIVTTLAAVIAQPDFRASADRVHELGYDTRDRFLNRMGRIWQDTAETGAAEELGEATTITIGGEERAIGKLAMVPIKTLRAFFDKIGVQQYDQAINSSLLFYADGISKRLEEVAMNYGQARDAAGLQNFDPTNPDWQLKPDEWSSFDNYKKNEDSLALFHTFLETSAAPEGFQLEDGLWRYYLDKKAGRPAKMFTDRQFDSVQRRLLAEFNASTPANRASAAAGNNVIRNLLTLQGYTSDGLLKLINSYGAIRDRKLMVQTLSKVPLLGTMALMVIAIGMFGGGLVGEYERWFRGRLPTLASPFDKDFWANASSIRRGIERLALAQLFYIGDLALWMRGETQGGRGFDPVGRVFPISIAQRIYKTAVGMWNTMKSGQASVGQVVRPMGDFGRSIFPYWLEAQRVFGEAQGVTKQGERLIRAVGEAEGLLPESRVPSQGPIYGPTTIIRRDLSEAASSLYQARQNKDEVAARAAITEGKSQMQKLEDYHTAKYIERGDDPVTARDKAQRDVWNDYQELNPVVAGLLGRRPTTAQFDLLQKSLTGARGKVVEDAIKAWQNGANEFFGREGVVTREDVAASRGSLRIRPATVTSVSAPATMGIARLPGGGGLRPARVRGATTGVLRPARAVRPLSAVRPARAPRPRRPRQPSVTPRIRTGPTIQRDRSRLGRLRRLNRRFNRRMNRRRTYVFE